NSKIKAVFLYNFTRYFEWPEKKRVNDFVIYVVGKNDNLITELNQLAKTKKVGNQPIEIKNTREYETDIQSHMIYFLPDAARPLSDAASRSRNKEVLVVGETAGACRSGASINFIVIDNKLRFEYNRGTAVRAGLKTNDDF